MMSRIRILAAYAAGLFIAAIFVDSLRFKFAGHETPRHIFSTLRDWSGIELFYPAGPWIIGLAELAAALLLIAAALAMRLTGRKIVEAASQVLGAFIALCVMSGAIGFHLFTPLGIETPVEWAAGAPTAFSPALFIAASISWSFALLIIALRGREALGALSVWRTAPAAA
ncbi:MAG: hypothetical protein RIA71_12965 [Oceanicaulis sp.]